MVSRVSRAVAVSTAIVALALAGAGLLPAERAIAGEAAMGQQPADKASPIGRWLAEDIRGGGVIDNLQTVLEIAEDGKVSGSGGCNRMSAVATVSGEDITFGPIAATRMACAPASMNQETKFFAALAEARTWQADPSRGKLTLLGEGGAVLVVLSRI